MNITIKVIPHHKQRYDTVGDWFFTKRGNLEIRVSMLSDWRREFLIAIHELAEVAICKYQGITQQVVDRFDMDWKPHNKMEEPGEDPEAPYESQHCFAMGIEHLMASALGVKWSPYADEVDALPPVKKKK